jgi:hypothetical protein
VHLSGFEGQKTNADNLIQGESHGCPYRHFSVDNLTSLLQAVGVQDREVLRGVKEDKEKMKFHLACNRFVSPFLSSISISLPKGPISPHFPSTFTAYSPLPFHLSISHHLFLNEEYKTDGRYNVKGIRIRTQARNQESARRRLLGRESARNDCASE